MPILLTYLIDMPEQPPSSPVLQGAVIGDGWTDYVLQGAVIGDGWPGFLEQGDPRPGDGVLPVSIPRCAFNENSLVPMAIDVLDLQPAWRSAVVDIVSAPALLPVPPPDPRLVKPDPWLRTLQARVLCSQSGDAPFLDVGTVPDATNMYQKPNGVEGSYHIRCMTGVYANVGLVPTVFFTPETSTVRYAVTGSTLDSGGVALPSCRVVMLDMSRMAVTGSPVIGEAISSAVDGSFSIPVPSNADYILIAYLPGSPDRAGVTLRPLTPTQIG